MSQTPRYSTGEIRRQMDVFTLDAVYLGSVLWISAERGDHVPPNLGPDVLQTSTVDGEMLGPMPTQALGNTGPVSQAARAKYATGATGAESFQSGTLLVGKFHGLLGIRRVSIDDIQTVAMERIVLRQTFDELDE